MTLDTLIRQIQNFTSESQIARTTAPRSHDDVQSDLRTGLMTTGYCLTRPNHTPTAESIPYTHTHTYRHTHTNKVGRQRVCGDSTVSLFCVCLQACVCLVVRWCTVCVSGSCYNMNFFLSGRRRHTSIVSVTGVQT